MSVDIAARVATLHETINAACDRAGRDPAGITIVAISKKHPQAAILEAMAAGIRHFGENRLNEAQVKIPAIAHQTDTPPVWHMVGHIQSRKAKHIPGLFQRVHSVDSVKLARRLSRFAQDDDLTLDVLLEINISGEDSKHGFLAHNWQSDESVRDALWQQLRDLLTLPALRVTGLMTMAPFVDDMDQIRPVFRDLATLRRALTDSLDVTLPDLSMGMSNDYPVAIEEGATLIRPGTAIFGPRQV